MTTSISVVVQEHGEDKKKQKPQNLPLSRKQHKPTG